MRIDLVTLFPEMFSVVRDLGVTGRAHGNQLWSLHTHSPRDYTEDVHRTVDDRPYGGGPGMVMMAEPLTRALSAIRTQRATQEQATQEQATQEQAPVVLLSPIGKPFDQAQAKRLAQSSGAIFICGRYEGVDQRFIDQHVDEQWSLGDFVLSGGEIAAMALLDAVARLQPGVLGDADSHAQDSFNPALDGLLDCPHYTRPEQWQGQGVPAALMSGHHINIERWRRDQRLLLTARLRPELIEAARAASKLTAQDEAVLKA